MNPFSSSQAPLSTPPSDDRRIEVTEVIDEHGISQVLVQDLRHGAGVGWYVQRTIRLDRAEVDALLRKLCCARQARSRSGLGACPVSSRPEAATPVAAPQLLIDFFSRQPLPDAE
jgi:hypothetical protein